MGKRSRSKGVETKRADGSTYRQCRRRVEPDHSEMLARIVDDVEREKRIRTLTAPLPVVETTHYPPLRKAPPPAGPAAWRNAR